MRRVRGAASVVGRAIREFTSDRCPQMAAAIAYHVLFSAVPVAALMVAIFGFVTRVPAIQQHVLEQILGNLPVKAGLVVDSMRAVSGASEPLTILGVLGLVWAAVGLFGTIRDAVNIAWGVRQGRGLIRQPLFDLGAVLGLVVLIAVSIAGTLALHAIRDIAILVSGGFSPRADTIWTTLRVAFPAVITFIAFLFLYRFVPNVRHGFRDVWPGALAAAVLFEAGKYAFTWYVSHWSGATAVYGALGTVMLFLFWVYLSAMILLACAKMTSLYEEIVGRGAAPRPRPPAPASAPAA